MPGMPVAVTFQAYCSGPGDQTSGLPCGVYTTKTLMSKEDCLDLLKDVALPTPFAEDRKTLEGDLTTDEIAAALCDLQSGKAAGLNVLPVEV
ncbi:hypothetical protein NDU88_001790 [Pleurodeles waltl]|uniref:Uncharacterized protein n=1 Tax=Pleurodeles waltl TaxID=8319 RepID=A0AAV7TIR6_PLEWA|nr:hypothetical protein NDU88_001790 [Pleurodeles waltl]